MVRPVRMSIIAISVVLVLFTLPMGVSAKKKVSKRKNRNARSVAVVVMPRVVRSVPVVVTPPVLSPAVAEDISFIRAEGAAKASTPATPAAPATAGDPTSQGSGDSEGKGRKPWAIRPLTPAAGSLIISEFRVSGTGGFADEYIEIYNDSGADHTVTASSGTGYGIAASDGITRCSIPNGTVIPARGHYLCVNSAGYSLSTYPSGNGTTATGDATYTTQITGGEDPDGVGGNPPTPRQGIALFNNNSGGGSFSLANQFDAVGPTGGANPLYKEGTGLPHETPSLANYAWVRDECGKGGAVHQEGQCTITTPKDTGDNAADFYFVDISSTFFAGSRLGAPGPQNLSSPIQRNSTITENLLDSTVAKSSPPNRVRDFTSDPANNSTFGTLSLRRRFVNNTGGSITRLRFRIIDIDTRPQTPGFADLRARNSTAVVVSGINDTVTCLATGAPGTPPCSATVQGTTLEVATALGTGQPNGGAFNSSLSAGTVTLGTPLANGASINLLFLFGLQQTGNFRVYVNIEALP